MVLNYMCAKSLACILMFIKTVKLDFFYLLWKHGTFARMRANYHKINYAFIFVLSLAVGHVAVETCAGFREVWKWVFNKNCAASTQQNGIQECNRFTDSEATKNY